MYSVFYTCWWQNDMAFYMFYTSVKTKGQTIHTGPSGPTCECVNYCHHEIWWKQKCITLWSLSFTHDAMCVNVYIHTKNVVSSTIFIHCYSVHVSFNKHCKIFSKKLVIMPAIWLFTLTHHYTLLAWHISITLHIAFSSRFNRSRFFLGCFSQLWEWYAWVRRRAINF